MKLSDLHLPTFPLLRLNRTASGRYVGEMAEVKSATIVYADGSAIDCALTVGVSTGAIIEVRVEDVEAAN